MNDDLWFWLGCYFAVGVIFLLSARMIVKLYHKDNRTDFVKGALAALENDKPLRERRREFFKSIGAGALVFVVWPVAFVVLINELVGIPVSSNAKGDEPKFWSENKDLIEIVNPREVEASARVHDPKKRVPNLPFGHLNRGWKELRAQMRPGDVMWSFKTSGYQKRIGDDDKGPRYDVPRNIVQGYAIVRSKKIVGEFLTQWN